MNEMTRLTSKRLPLRYIILLLLLTLSVSAVSLSRYSTTVAGSGSVSVARPVVVYTSSSNPWFGDGDPAAFKPGQTLERHFSVRNVDGTAHNEVSMQYEIIVSVAVPSVPVLPLTYSVKAWNETAQDWLDYLGPVSMGFGANEEHLYKLVITWDKKDNSATFMDLTQQIRIDITAVQKD